MAVRVFIVILLSLHSIARSSCFNLILEKSYQQVPSKQTFTVLCQADVPLTACQVKRYYNQNLNIFFDLSRGNDTPPMAAIAYAGEGLESGQCGVTVTKQSFAGGYNVYGCRARSGGGGWKHRVAVVDVSDGTYWTLPVESPPDTILAEPGSNVTLSFSTGGTLNFCNFKWPGLTNWTRSGEDGTFSIDNAGLDEGQCHLTLYNVSADSSGFILTDIRSKYRIKGKRGDFIHVTTLVVKAAPSPPALTLHVNDSAVLEATCSVHSARPAAHITWFLGDEVVRNDLLDDSDSGSVWSWEFEAQNMTQHLHRKLLPGDDGKELVCRVQHIALPGGWVEASQNLTIRADTSEWKVPAELVVESNVSVKIQNSGILSFHWSKHGTWLLVGAGSSLLFTIVVVLISWTVYKCYKGTCCSGNKDSDQDRSSHIYDDVDLSNGYECVGTGAKRSEDFLEMNECGSNSRNCQDFDKL